MSNGNIFQAALQKVMSGRYKQKELAELVDISIPYLNDLYRGRKNGQEPVRRRIASALGYEDYETFLDVGRLELGLAPLRAVHEKLRGTDDRAAEFFKAPFSDNMLLSGMSPNLSIAVTSDEKRSPVMVHGPSLGVASARGLQAFRVEDDAMEPMIGYGGIVLADLTRNDPASLREGDLYVLCWESLRNRATIRRLKWAEKGKILAMESENPSYETVYRGIAEVRLIGKVIWSSRNHK